MEKITNCPNNTFDCGFGCGLTIATDAVIKVMKKIDDTEKVIKIIKKFSQELHSQVDEKHMEHMNERYQWEKLLDGLLKD